MGEKLTGRKGSSVGGRQYLDPAMRWQARLEAAYFLSKWNGSISEADRVFAKAAGGVTTGSADRRKVFESLLRDETCLPRDVVECMAKDLRFCEIGDISTSPFFKVVTTKVETVEEAVAMVATCLNYLGLTRMSVGLEEEWIAAYAQRYAPTLQKGGGTEADLAWESLSVLIHQRPVTLAVIALLGALYREAYLSFELSAAQRLGHWFWVLLEEYLSGERFSSLQSGFADYMVSRVLYGRGQGEAGRAMDPYQFPRLPDRPIGILIPRDDPDYQAFLDARDIHKSS